MPLYMDHHKNLEGLTAEAVAEDHKKDLEVQDKHGAKALRYWFNEENSLLPLVTQRRRRGVLGIREFRPLGSCTEASRGGIMVVLDRADPL